MQSTILDTSRRVRVSEAGILTLGEEELEIEDAPVAVGRAICVVSGNRLAFRRVLGVEGKVLRLRADIAPFEDRWEGDVVGCVVPRIFDRAAAIAPERFTRASWRAAVAYAHAQALRRRMKRPKPYAFRTELLDTKAWPAVRSFWKRACGRELPVEAQPRQHVIGLFDGDEIVGANIYLAFGNTAFSAFTLVDRRFRGFGGGSLMLGHAVREAKRRDFESMYVHINARNLPSIAAYRRVGFVSKGWWSDAADPLASAERHWLVHELDLRKT